MALHSARERATLVPEQFAGHQPLGKRGRVDRNERAAGALAQPVDAARHKLFAHSRLALDQHGGVGGGHLLHLGLNQPHRIRAADDLVKMAGLRHFHLKKTGLALQAIPQQGDLLVRLDIIQRDRHLGADRFDQRQVFVLHAPRFMAAVEIENAQHARLK